MGIYASILHTISNIGVKIMNFELFLSELEETIRDSSRFIKLIYATGLFGLMPLILREVFG